MMNTEVQAWRTHRSTFASVGAPLQPSSRPRWGARRSLSCESWFSSLEQHAFSAVQPVVGLAVGVHDGRLALVACPSTATAVGAEWHGASRVYVAGL